MKNRVWLVFALTSCSSEPNGSLASGSASTAAESSATPLERTSASAATSATQPETLLEPESLPEMADVAKTIADQRAAILRRMKALGVADEKQAAAIDVVFSKSDKLGQGTPESTSHPLTREQCFERRKAAGVRDEKKNICKAPLMVPLYRPGQETEDKATTCIDRYEFPGLPCEYPVTWVTTAEAQEICRALGKRVCDAHEWEGACAGELLPPEEEYAFGRPRETMRGMHNIRRKIVWAYGDKRKHANCGTDSTKSPDCNSSGWKKCGSNTYPAGSFPSCRSPLGVYDLHGNAAEHMWLPMRADQLGKRGGFGIPEMKGSWFIFAKYEAHIDDCRWRAPDWHEEEGNNHSNYHLGFRCCKDL